MNAITNSRPAPISDRAAFLAAALLASIAGAAAIWFFYSAGSLLYYGDAESHLNIARRIVDSRTPGYDQLGSVWLPLPHVLMLPLVGSMALWQSGLAGSIPAALCFAAAAGFLHAAVARIFDHRAAATAAALFVLNPNALYLQSIPMTEAIFFAALLALLYFTVKFTRDPSPRSAVCAGMAALAGTLTRYEGWFLLPFAALFLLIPGGRKRLIGALLFGAIAALGPLWWLAHNWWIYGNALDFYNGPGSPRAIQGSAAYPGKGDWFAAARYFLMAVKLVAGAPLFWMGWAGVIVACVRRAFWPVLLLALPALFYVWSIHSAATPIYVPVLPPFSWYNTRYGLAALPLLVFGCGALASAFPRIPRWSGVAILLFAMTPWLLHPHRANWVTWKESQVNSDARRAWTAESAAYLRANFRRGDTVFTSFNDLTGIYRSSGIPLRRTLTGDNGPYFEIAAARPEIFLRDRWAIAIRGDAVETAVARTPRFRLVREIVVPGAPPVDIYRQ